MGKKRDKSKVVELLKKMPTEVQQELLAGAGFEPPDGGEPDPLEGTPYTIRGGCLCWKKPTRDGQVILPLCNFTARVVRDVSRDDGAEVQRIFEIEGRLASGKKLPRIAVPAEKFFSMAWVANWGIDAVISAGQGAKDRLREAIQLASRGAVQERVFVHLGWRKLDGKWVYLHSGGAIGADGVLVEPEMESLRRYELPEDGSPEEGMKASLRLLDIGPREVLLPLWAAVWRAPTACLLYPTVVLWLYGQTGSFKSTVAALFLRHFGHFTKDSLPASWLGSDNSLERICFLARDMLMVVDDYAPEAHPREAATLDKRVNRLVRQVGNRAARTRLGSDLRLKPEMPPNGLIVATGEQLPLGVQSVAARILPVRFEKEKFDLAKLSQAQAEAYLLAQAMRGYIEWLAPQMDDLVLRLPSRFEELRAKAAIEGHARLPEAVAHLQLGAELGVAYAASLGVLTEAEAKELANECFAALVALAQEHARTLEEEKPTARFFQALEAIFVQGKGHLTHRLTGETGEYGHNGDLLGWYDENGLYLHPKAVWRAVQEYLKHEGGLPIRERTLREMLAREGYLVTRPGRLTSTVWIGYANKAIDVLWVKPERLNDISSSETAKTAKTDDENAPEASNDAASEPWHSERESAKECQGDCQGRGHSWHLPWHSESELPRKVPRPESLERQGIEGSKEDTLGTLGGFGEGEGYKKNEGLEIDPPRDFSIDDIPF